MSNSGNSEMGDRPQIDKLYVEPREAITGFVFDKSVVAVFEDMISRSVPGYSTLLSMISVLSRYFVRENTHCYDLGCSLGAASLALQQSIECSGVKLIAIDNSSAMIDQCREIMDKHPGKAQVSVHEGDVCKVPVSNASLVIMNFTLQFIAEAEREALIHKIYDGLIDGGAFLLSEKITFNDDIEKNRLIDLHHAFKKANGYSDMEISQKRSALENVLIPETLEQHKTRLKNAGFSEVFVWFQCFNFVSILAIK